MSVIDHLVLAVPDLDEAADWFASATGVRPAPGGAHVGMGTHNALVSFGSGYLELIAPDPTQPDPEDGRPFGIDTLDERRLVAFAVRPDSDTTIDGMIEAAGHAGYEPGEAVAMTRLAPGGVLLHWRLTFPRTSWSGIDLHGTVPFVIDWADTPMPATTAPGGLELLEFAVDHPEPATIEAAHRALGIDVEVRPSTHAGLTARLAGPGGTIDL